MTTIAFLALPLLADGPVFPPDVSSNGAGVDQLFWLATWMGAVCFAIVVGILAWSVLAWRERPGRRALHLTGTSKGAKVFTGVFAFAVFVILDVNLAVKDHRVYEEMYGSPPKPGEALEVEVLAKRYEWLFRYPGKDGKFGTDDDLRTPLLVIPEDRVVVARMKSIDVIHSLFLPHFRTKQDVVPGMVTSMVLRPGPASAGEYEIVCAELCGYAHYRMKGTLKVLTRPAFDAWTAEQEKDVEEYGATASEEFWSQWDLRSRKEEGR